MKQIILRKTKKILSKPKEEYLKLKRSIDIFLSLIILFIFFPLFILTSIIILLDDGFPVFFKQSRTGVNNTIFKMYKFRTMRITKETHKNQEYGRDWKDGVPDNFVFKSSFNNPNVTKSGYYLRKFSIDELPQFINVLKGDMSIVGPRPEIPEITKHYNGNQIKRLDLKPGITGFAQVNGRSELLHGDKIKYDIEYINKVSTKFDLIIIAKTIIQALGGKGSY